MTGPVNTLVTANGRGAFEQQIEDANALLAHAVSQGKTIDDRVIQTIIEAKLRDRTAPPSPAEWADLARAYRDLADVMGDVNARTLEATSEEHGMSEARRWSRRLWRWTILFAVAIVVAENYQTILNTFFARDENTSEGLLTWYILNIVLQALVPFAFGGLGAATYLLRSAHAHLSARTFDPHYIPEYLNRLLLGVIAGGTIELLIDTVTQDGAVIELSAAAVAFIAGYNADLLFKTIERLSEALLPKVGIESMRRAAAPQVAGTSLPALFTQLDQAQTPEAKAAITGYIAKLKERV